jgi:hypothetical protein
VLGAACAPAATKHAQHVICGRNARIRERAHVFLRMIKVKKSRPYLIMPGSRVRVPPFPPIKSERCERHREWPVGRKRRVSVESRPSADFDREIQVFSTALISANQNLGNGTFRPADAGP